jgi:Na+/H+-dicarboxylate symporter
VWYAAQNEDRREVSMKLLKTYGFPLLLLLSIAGGVLLGSCRPDAARAIRPLGDLFLNLIFMIIVPLIFFTVSSVIASSTVSRWAGLPGED